MEYFLKKYGIKQAYLSKTRYYLTFVLNLKNQPNALNNRSGSIFRKLNFL